MKARNDVSFGPYSIEQQNGIFYGQSVNMRDELTKSAIIRGNFKDPNYWSYIVRYNRTFRSGLDGYRKLFSPPGVWQNTIRGHMGSSSDPLFEPNDTSLENSVYNLALDRLNEKVRGGLDLSIALAESGQTVRMLKTVTKVITHARQAVKRAAYEKLKFGRFVSDTSKHLADGYLQYTYGWKPLISDVFGVANEGLRRTLNELQSFNGRGSMPINADGTFFKRVNSFNLAPVRVEGKGRYCCEIGVNLAPPTKGCELSRWTSLNPVSIAWELIPYSFVVDWFLDVGSYLRNVETGLLYDTVFRGGYVSKLVWWNGREEVVNGSYPTGTGEVYEFKNVYGESKYRNFQRSALTSYPFPRKPTVSVDLSSSRLLSAASLLRQILSRV